MSRYNSSGYGHFCKCDKWSGMTFFTIGWYWDRYYSNSRQRFPQKMIRDTDKKGAIRFCKKWNIRKLPEELKNEISI